jgi:hypothetical protein
MSGSLLLLAYAIAQRDPVIILGQSFGIVVYLRNLKLIQHHERGDQHGEEETLGETLHADEAEAEDAEPISPETEPVAVPTRPTQGL